MGLKKNEYFLVSCHREENVEDPKEFEKFIELLRRLADQYSFASDCFHASAHAKKVEQFGF